MSVRDEIADRARAIFGQTWDVEGAFTVPDPDSIVLARNHGKRLVAAVLYADLADSTGLVESEPAEFAAEIYRAYLDAASRIIRNWTGEITAFDGDRVMGVFAGVDRLETLAKLAMAAGLEIAGAVKQILQPELDAAYGPGRFVIRQKVGIDLSILLAAQTGIRGNRDLVWVGTAANRAAKLAARDDGYSTYVTEIVYQLLGPVFQGYFSLIDTSAPGMAYGSNVTMDVD